MQEEGGSGCYGENSEKKMIEVSGQLTNESLFGSKVEKLKYTFVKKGEGKLTIGRVCVIGEFLKKRTYDWRQPDSLGGATKKRRVTRGWRESRR